MQGMELAQFCSTSRVVIVAGKGGVGKTTVTAALSVAAARTGMSVLIVEVEGKSGLAAAFDRPRSPTTKPPSREAALRSFFSVDARLRGVGGTVPRRFIPLRFIDADDRLD